MSNSRKRKEVEELDRPTKRKKIETEEPEFKTGAYSSTEDDKYIYRVETEGLRIYDKDTLELIRESKELPKATCLVQGESWEWWRQIIIIPNQAIILSEGAFINRTIILNFDTLQLQQEIKDLTITTDSYQPLNDYQFISFCRSKELGSGLYFFNFFNGKLEFSFLMQSINDSHDDKGYNPGVFFSDLISLNQEELIICKNSSDYLLPDGTILPATEPESKNSTHKIELKDADGDITHKKLSSFLTKSIHIEKWKRTEGQFILLTKEILCFNYFIIRSNLIPLSKNQFALVIQDVCTFDQIHIFNYETMKIEKTLRCKDFPDEQLPSHKKLSESKNWKNELREYLKFASNKDEHLTSLEHKNNASSTKFETHLDELMGSINGFFVSAAAKPSADEDMNSLVKSLKI